MDERIACPEDNPRITITNRKVCIILTIGGQVTSDNLSSSDNMIQSGAR